MQTEFCNLPLDSLQPGQYQMRRHFDQQALEELAQSIATQGLIEPLVVRLIAAHSYEIIAGERRWRAAKMAGLLEVPCLVGAYSDKQACALTLVENIQRQDLNIIEEAAGYKRLVDEFQYQQDEIAILVSKSRSHVANILRLLSLTESVKNQLRNQTLSLGHGRLLVGLAPSEQTHFAEQCLQEQWSVRQLEQAVKQFKNKAEALPKNPKRDRDVARLETLLSDQVGAPVQIASDMDQGGWLKLKFFDNDTLAGLLEKLGLRYD